MKAKIYLFLICLLTLTVSVSAKTYTLKSGKWTNPAIWGNNYPGTTVKPEDIVIVEGLVVIDSSIIVEGILWIERGASMVGSRNLTIAKSGKFINYGNTMVGRIMNEGRIVNNQSMDAITDIDNKGTIDNASNLVAGNDFNNANGTVKGEKSTYFAQNNIISSPDSKFGPGVHFYYGHAVEKAKDSISVSQGVSLKESENKAEIDKILQVHPSSPDTK